MPRTLEIEGSDLEQVFHERGWTDGLPVVAPTVDRVRDMLAAAKTDPEGTIGIVPQRGVIVTAENLAVSAVMAGCAPGHFSVLLAAAGAMLDPVFNPHAALASTGGAAISIVVSGPMAEAIGMNARRSALGPGNRANASIGRALRLLAINTLGARPGEMDGSSLGNPAKYTLCFAEGAAPSNWEPLRVWLGYEEGDTTVTAMAAEGPHQIGNHHAHTGEEVLQSYASAMRSPTTYSVGKGGQAILVVGPEHAALLERDRWSRRQAAEYVARESRLAPDAFANAGIALLQNGPNQEMRPGPDGRLPSVASSEDILFVTAGGDGPGWSAYIPSWAPVVDTRAVTRRVRELDEPLPECGPDGCLVDFSDFKEAG